MMKTFKIKDSMFSSIQLMNENGECVGKILFNLISGVKEKIKINDEVYRIKYRGFLWNDIMVFDGDEKLVVESDISKKQVYYYGNEEEIYTYKYDGWLSNKGNLFRNHELVTSINRNGIFKTKYEIKVENNFKNYLIILVFLNSYRSSSIA